MCADPATRTSRLPGLHARSVEERVRVVCDAAGVDEATARHLGNGGGLPIAAADRMMHHKLGCLPVIEGGKLVGILTEADYVRLARSMLARSGA